MMKFCRKLTGVLLMTFFLLAGSVFPAHARTQWVKSNGKWYCYENGYLLRNTTFTENGKLYYFNSSGAMHTGWLEMNGHWYYFDSSGAAKGNWLNLKGNWYFFDTADYHMLTEWQWDNDYRHQYYLDPKSGVMLSSTWKSHDNLWYYLDSSGALKTGWMKYQNKWYYFLPGSGHMMLSTWISDETGTIYYLDSNGQWDPKATPADAVPKGAVLKNGISLGGLDRAPYAFYTGWIVQKHGRYGFVRPNGSWQLSPIYTSVCILPDACYAIFRDQYSNSYVLDEYGNFYEYYSGFYSSAQDYPVLDSEGYLGFWNGSSQYLDYSQYDDYSGIQKVYRISDRFSLDKSQYYLWRTETSELFGPYEASIMPSAYSSESNPNSFHVSDVHSVFGKYSGLFCSGRNGQMYLENEWGKTSQNWFSLVEFTDPFSVCAWTSLSKPFTVYNQYLNPVYSGSIDPWDWLESGTGAINGKALVLYYGNWYLIRI